MLFTVNNPKTLKGEAAGYMTAILHLAPADTSGHNVCPKSTPECRALCLNTAGRGGIGLTTVGDNKIQAARRRRTEAYFEDPTRFSSELIRETRRLYDYAFRRNLKLAVRINGTSDLPGLAQKIAQGFTSWVPYRDQIQFYDYTEIIEVALKSPSDVHYTFSRSESNEADCERALRAGVNVAVVFSTKRGQELPMWHTIGSQTHAVIDGDATDLRFLDQPGVIVGLRAKGRARKHIGGFVIAV